MSRTKVELFYKDRGEVPLTIECAFASLSGMFLVVHFERGVGHTTFINLTDVTHYVEYPNYKGEA